MSIAYFEFIHIHYVYVYTFFYKKNWSICFLYQTCVLCKDWREDDDNEMPKLLNCMLSNKTLLMMYRHCFNSKHWRNKEVNPLSTPLSLRSWCFFLYEKTRILNLGQGSSQLI